MANCARGELRWCRLTGNDLSTELRSETVRAMPPSDKHQRDSNDFTALAELAEAFLTWSPP